VRRAVKTFHRAALSNLLCPAEAYKPFPRRLRQLIARRAWRVSLAPPLKVNFPGGCFVQKVQADKPESKSSHFHLSGEM
jgi:hypothetical protein